MPIEMLLRGRAGIVAARAAQFRHSQRARAHALPPASASPCAVCNTKATSENKSHLFWMKAEVSELAMVTHSQLCEKALGSQRSKFTEWG